MQHYSFQKNKKYGKGKTKRYKDFLEKGIRLSKTSVFYYYNGRFYRDRSDVNHVELMYKGRETEYTEQLFMKKGIELPSFSQKTIEPIKPLTRIDLLIMD